MRALLQKLTGLNQDDAPQAGFAFAFFFSLLAGYYVIQPLRDEMGLLMGKEYTPWLFGASMIAMIVLNPLFGLLLQRVGRRTMIKAVYRFFAFNLIAFILAFKYLEYSGLMVSHGQAQRVQGLAFGVAFAFFLWASVFNLFATSIFWAIMADTYSSEKSKKVFGFLGAGGTLGQMFGSGLTTLLATRVPGFQLTNLLILSVILLEIAVRMALKVAGDDKPSATTSEAKPHPFSGLTDILKSPYLLGICFFLFLYTFTSSFIYFQKQAIVEDSLAGRGARVGFFSHINLIVSVTTFLIQLFLTRGILSVLGLSLGLALVPIITLAGFLALAQWPTLSTIALLDVVRKTANYAISRPSREVLFTVVSQREKYLAKNFIDTVVYRLGDSGAAALFEVFFRVGTSPLIVSAWAITATLGYLGLSLALGRAQGQRSTAIAAMLPK